MGYTHYWSHDDKLNWKALSRALDDMATLARAAPKFGIVLRGPLGTGEPELSRYAVALNGDGEAEPSESHETFVFPIVGEDAEMARKLHGKLWSFCKTARRPYDTVVCAMLLAAKHHLGSQLRLSSDGERTEDEWLPAERMVAEVLGYHVEFVREETI